MLSYEEHMGMVCKRIQIAQPTIVLPRLNNFVIMVAGGGYDNNLPRVDIVREGDEVRCALHPWTPLRESHARQLLHDEFCHHLQNQNMSRLNETAYEYYPAQTGIVHSFCIVLLCGPVKLNQKHKCHRPIRTLLSDGCKCGGI